MTRKTSIETYRQIEAEGLLSKKRWAVYQTLFKIGPATAAEIADASSSKHNPSVGDNTHARLIELVALGCVEEIGERKCRVTGRNVILWDLTPRLPKKKQFFNSEKERLRKKLSYHEKMAAQAKKKLRALELKEQKELDSRQLELLK